MIAAPLAPIVGVSPAIKNATALIERFAPTALPILLIGATGTGKELFAQHIHHRSRRRGQLVDLNCGALPHEMTESLLFGHRRGAFTGAVESVVGHIERASEGTLFLDEVVHLSVSGQVKLLRALETGEVQPLGEQRKRVVDFRVVSAAQEDAIQQLDTGAFRRDLFQRLAGVVIDLPQLAARPEDIVPLATQFAGTRGQLLQSGTERVLQDYSWPGNVRELRLAIERAGCLVENSTLPPGAIRDAIALGAPRERTADRRSAERRGQGSELRQQLAPQRFADELVAMCKEHGWDAARVAEHLGVARSTVYNRLKAAGVSLRYLRKAGDLEFQWNSNGIPENDDAAKS